MTCIAIVPAAGSGTRLGSQVPKALVKLANNQLIIERTLCTLRDCHRFDRIIICVSPGESDKFAFLQTNSPIPISLVDGGLTRSHSVANAIASLSSLAETTRVLIHDAARCMVSVALVQRCLNAALTHPAVVAAIPVVDTIRELSADKKRSHTLKRDNLFAVQTPQVFELGLLRRAMQDQANSECATDASDEAQLVEKIAPILMVAGEPENIKITYLQQLEAVNSALSRAF